MNIRSLKNLFNKPDFPVILIQKIKQVLNLEANSQIGYLGRSVGEFYYFIFENRLFVTNLKFENDKPDFNYLAEINYETLSIKEIINEKNIKLSPKTISIWLNSPNSIVENVDDTHLEIINFIKNYKIEDFKFKNYIFYTYDDNKSYYGDSLIYCKNLKTNYVTKIYAKYCYKEKQVPPSKLSDLLIIDDNQKLTPNQKTKIKKAFLEFCKNEDDFYRLDLLDKINRSIILQHGIAVHRIFAGDLEFANIWVEDFLSKDEEPFFFLTDDPLFFNTTKIAMLYFKKPKYKSIGIYKHGIAKYGFWNLEKEYIEKLIKFLNAPYKKESRIDKNAKTNWQKLITEYNYNTAEPLGLKKLPLNLEIPNYMEIFND